MAIAKRRLVQIGKSKIYQYHCGNCGRWFTPQNASKPEFPSTCKNCNTQLNYENGIEGDAEFVADDKGWD